MFWTNRVPSWSVNGTSWHVDHLALFDYFSVGNALADGNSVDAKVTFTLTWASSGKAIVIDDGKNFHFKGKQTSATAVWSASEAGFTFGAHQTTKVNFAVFGGERNGVFYSG